MDDKKEYCVKLLLSDEEYRRLKIIANYLESDIKKLVNRCIKRANSDIYNSGSFHRNEYFSIEKVAKYKERSVKIKKDYYECLRDNVRILRLNIRDIIKDIVLWYSNDEFTKELDENDK